ncbi:MAG: TetR/AcrR family transcriptional regulator [Pseudomonadota bacterium]|nr:TetR/AcrR family transcriptional regulator [Pseudomonadota bacterium]
MSETKPKRATGTKEKILQVACIKYLESGDKGLSMRAIAKDVGITPMAIYKHFANKEDLQNELLLEAFRVFYSYLYPALKGADAKQRFHIMTDGYFEFAAKQSAYFELIFLSTNPMNNLKLKDVIREESTPSFRFLMDRVRDCMESRYFAQGNVYEVSVALLAQSTGLSALYLSNSFGWDEDSAREMQRRIISQVLAGFLTDKPG